MERGGRVGVGEWEEGRGGGEKRRGDEIHDGGGMGMITLHTVVSWGGLASLMPLEISFRSFSACTVNWSHTFSGEYTFVGREGCVRGWEG